MKVSCGMRNRTNRQGYLFRWDKDVSTDHKKMSVEDADRYNRTQVTERSVEQNIFVRPEKRIHWKPSKRALVMQKFAEQEAMEQLSKLGNKEGMRFEYRTQRQILIDMISRIK